MNIALAQINVHVGNFDANLVKMLEYTAKAKAQGADVVVFPELATVGYPPRDFLEFDDFVEKAEAVISAYFLAQGRIQNVQHKTLLPTYDIFDEYRYFEPAHEWGVVRYMDKTIALVVCEDSWNVGNENPLYKINPMDQMMEHKPDLIINVSASPFAYDHAANRIEVMQTNCKLYNLPMYYVNHVGAQTEVLFDGASLVLHADGTVIDEMPYFEESMRIYNTDEVDGKSNVSGEEPKDKMTLIHDGIVMGIKNYFGKLGFRRAILGLSGGSPRPRKRSLHPAAEPVQLRSLRKRRPRPGPKPRLPVRHHSH